MLDSITIVLVAAWVVSTAAGCAAQQAPEGEDVAFDQPEPRGEKSAAEARRLPGEKASAPLPPTVDAARRGATIQSLGGGLDDGR